jgi:altronate hydrolase
VPTLKIATNSDLATRKSSWVDFNAGQLLENKTMPELADQLFAHVVDIASGRKQARNEENGFREIAIFKDGVTL